LSHEERVSLIVPDHPDLSLRRQTALLGISRASLTYAPKVSEQDLTSLRALDEIYTAHPFYGSRRMQVVLGRDYEIAICRDHVRRLMRRLGLEAIYPRAKPRTSDGDSEHRIYPYLLGNIMASYPNHIWGTDITYIRMNDGFCYLVAIIDWYSRYVIAWQISSTLEIEFCLKNLAQALATAVPTIHNSDQGSHFTSPRYTGPLATNKVQISMDGRGRCMDNIFTERLWRTVKYEEVYLKSYQTIEEAKTNLKHYFRFYNEERPHQSLGNKVPAEVYGQNKKARDSKEHTLADLSLSNLSTILV
jgi:putative transposase